MHPRGVPGQSHKQSLGLPRVSTEVALQDVRRLHRLRSGCGGHGLLARGFAAAAA